MNTKTYKAFVQVDDRRSCQLVIMLPQSKIGYTYPELYWCVPTPQGLCYRYMDIITRTVWKADEAEFLRAYTDGEELTEDIFKELGIFRCSMKELAGSIYDQANAR